MSYVTKRDGRKEEVSFDKITERIKRLINPEELKPYKDELSWLNLDQEEKYLRPSLVAMKVIPNLTEEIMTEQLDIVSADICMDLGTTHPSYFYLGGRILVSNLHKKTIKNFSDKIILLANDTEMINEKFLNYVKENRDVLDKIINYNLDYVYDYFGFKTLEKSYLLKNRKGHIIERPQDMLMRVAVSLQMGNLERIEETYRMMSYGMYTHASPTLYNAGTTRQQLSSCFLGGIDDDLASITDSWSICSQISKYAGGIGLNVSDIRAKNSLIKGTNGKTDGLVPLMILYSNLSRYVNQGGRRPGSIATYLADHHSDIFEFLNLRKNHGSETERARDLFLAVVISNLFMKMVESDGDWYLMSSDDCPGLTDTYGDEYEALYWSYVNTNKYRSKIPARKLWLAIMESQIETGMPYIMFKDSVNEKSNQKNIGIIKNSNLCIEIVQHSSSKEYAVCNLASISLKPFVKPYRFNPTDNWVIYSKPNCKYCDYTKNYLTNMGVKFTEVPFSNESLANLKTMLHKTGNTSPSNITFPQIFNNNTSVGGWHELYNTTGGTFDYDKLYETAYLATINLNQVIDINYYPVIQAKFSNMRHRPVGLGIQGLADALVLMRIPFDSDEAVEFNAKYMETIYLASITASNDMAKERYKGMKELVEWFSQNPSTHMEDYYTNNHYYLDEHINNLYHKLKPCSWEIKEKNTNSNLAEEQSSSGTTLGAYSTFDGSPFSQGLFQFDMWEDKPTLMYKDIWEALRKNVIKYGTRNSLVTALMPTASTSQILSNNECFEFFTNNIYTRKTQAGNFVMVNKYLVDDMIKINMWSKDIKDMIIANNGSIQSLDFLPPEIRNIYKTMWEIKQVWVLKGAKARGPFVDQTQSMNIFMAEPDYQRLGSSHFWAWKNGLKTGIYYLRTKPATDAIKFTIDPNLIKKMNNIEPENNTCENCSA